MIRWSDAIHRLYCIRSDRMGKNLIKSNVPIQMACDDCKWFPAEFFFLDIFDSFVDTLYDSFTDKFQTENFFSAVKYWEVSILRRDIKKGLLNVERKTYIGCVCAKKKVSFFSHRCEYFFLPSFADIKDFRVNSIRHWLLANGINIAMGIKSVFMSERLCVKIGVILLKTLTEMRFDSGYFAMIANAWNSTRWKWKRVRKNAKKIVHVLLKHEWVIFFDSIGSAWLWIFPIIAKLFMGHLCSFGHIQI